MATGVRSPAPGRKLRVGSVGGRRPAGFVSQIGAMLWRSVRADVWPGLRQVMGPPAATYLPRVGGSLLWQLVRVDARLTLGRRLRFAVVVVISQMLLVALAVAWLVHMILIAVNGAVFFVEQSPLILWTEIAASVLIIVFGCWVLAIQMARLGERRRGDDRRSGERRG